MRPLSSAGSQGNPTITGPDLDRFLRSGLVENCPSIMAFALEKLRIILPSSDHGIIPDGAADLPIVFDFDFLQASSITKPLTEDAFKKSVLPLYGAKLYSAIKYGTAVVIVRTYIGGYTGNARQIQHVATYALYGLERLVSNDSRSPHLVLFDGHEVEGQSRVWELSPLQRRCKTGRYPATSRDPLIADRLQDIFKMAASQIPSSKRNAFVTLSAGERRTLDDLTEWDLSTSPHKADRGCCIHGIINSTIAFSARAHILRALDKTLLSEQQTQNLYVGRDQLYDTIIPTIFQRFLWGPGTNLPRFSDFPCDRLLDETKQEHKKAGFPSWHDLALYQAITHAIYIKVCGGEESLPLGYNDVGDMLVQLQSIAEEMIETESYQDDMHEGPLDVEMQPSSAEPQAPPSTPEQDGLIDTQHGPVPATSPQ